MLFVVVCMCYSIIEKISVLFEEGEPFELTASIKVSAKSFSILDLTNGKCAHFMCWTKLVYVTLAMLLLK